MPRYINPLHPAIQFCCILIRHAADEIQGVHRFVVATVAFFEFRELEGNQLQYFLLPAIWRGMQDGRDKQISRT